MLFPISDRHENVLGQLSIELFAEIIGYLDSYSVVHLLMAFPQFKRYTVLITDHQLPPMFFNVHGLKRKALANAFTWDKNQPIDIDIYDGTTDSTPIKLFELAYPQSLEDLLDVKDSIAFNPFQRNKLNRASFVFVKTDLFETRQAALLAEHLDEYTDCKWHFGLPTHFPMEGLDNSWFDPQRFEVLPEKKQWPSAPKLGPVVSSQLGNDYYHDTLISLRLVNILKIENLNLPKLLDLALIFPSKEGPRPFVSNISAPNLKTLVIHYSGKIPRLEAMDDIAVGRYYPEVDVKNPQTVLSFSEMNSLGEYVVPEDSEIPALSPNDYKCFELANISSLQGNRQHFESEIDKNANRQSIPCIVELVAKFDVVHMIGVPSVVFHPDTFKKALRLRLQLVDSTAEQLNISSVVDLSLGLYGPNMKAPKLYCCGLGSFHLMIMTPTLELNTSEMINHSFSRSVNQLMLYRSVPLLKKGPPLCLSVSQWNKFLGCFGTINSSKQPSELFLSIVGFPMKWLSKAARHRIGLDRGFALLLYGSSQVRLRPVVRIIENTSPILTLKAIGWSIFGAKAGTLCQVGIMVSPITSTPALNGPGLDITPRPIALKIAEPPVMERVYDHRVRLSVGGHVTSCSLVSQVLLRQNVDESIRAKKLRMAQHEANTTYFRSLDNPGMRKDKFPVNHILHSWIITRKPPPMAGQEDDNAESYSLVDAEVEGQQVEVEQDDTRDNGAQNYGTSHVAYSGDTDQQYVRYGGGYFETLQRLNWGIETRELRLRVDSVCQYEPTFTLL